MATSRDSREPSTCFSASSSACIPWVVAVSLQSLLPQPLLSDPDPSTPFYEEFWIDIGPTHLGSPLQLKIVHLIKSVNPLLSGKVTHSQVPELRT